MKSICAAEETETVLQCFIKTDRDNYDKSRFSSYFSLLFIYIHKFMDIAISLLTLEVKELCMCDIYNSHFTCAYLLFVHLLPLYPYIYAYYIIRQ